MIPSANAAAPENQLLVCCARTRMDSQTARRICELTAGPLDWDYLLSLAAENSVMPLLGRHIPTIAMEVVARAPIKRLKSALRASTIRSLVLTAELINIMALLRERGIQAIPYKGPVLAAQAYGDITLREFEDLDIILRQRDMPQANEIMLGLGYRAKFPYIPSAGMAASRIPGEYNYTDDARRIIVELHTECTLRHFPVVPDLDDFAQRLVPIALSGHEIHTFCAEDALSVLCIHGAKDFWERLSWIADISELVQSHPHFDWDQALRRSETLKAQRMVHLGLALAAGLLDAPLPREILERVRADREASALATEIMEKLLSRETPQFATTRRFSFRRRLVPGTMAGWRYCLRLALAPAEEDWTTIRLPRPLAPLYVALRPLRLLRKYGWFGGGI